MRILAIDAALGPCSVALVSETRLLAQAMSDDPRGASMTLPGLVESVLAEAGSVFDSVAVTVGPGSFTGIRAALALAHGLALGAGVPILGVTSMAALRAAWTPVAGTALWVAIDTRRGRVFLDREGHVAAVSLDALPAAPVAVAVAVAGDAAEEVARRLGGLAAGIGRIEARFVALAARDPANATTAQPLYLEAPEARPAPQPRRGAA